MKRFFPNHVCLRLQFTALLACMAFSPFAQTGGVLQLLPQNGHYFLYQGKPTVIVGSGEHYGAVMNLDFDYITYLRTLQQDSLNTTRLFTGAYYEIPGAFGIERNTLAPKPDRLLLPWQHVNGRYGLTRWNGAYFARLHDFMQQAYQRGVIVEITLFSSYYSFGWAYHPFHGANNSNGTPTDLPAHHVNTLQNGSVLKFQEDYVRKLVRELNRYDNLYFEIQNEPWAEGKDTALVWNDYITADDLKERGNNWKNTLEIASAASRAWHQTVSRWIADEEKGLPKKHLISHNVANFGVPAFATDPRISIYNFHYARPEAVALNYKLNKVIGFNETGFAGKGDETYRRQAWRFMMSGGGLFGHLDYSFSVGWEAGTDTVYNAPGGGGAALRSQLRILKNYLNGLHLATLRPDAATLHHVEGAFAYCLKDATSRIIYLEPMLAAPARLTLSLPKGRYRVAWTDVVTGRVVKLETFQVISSKTILMSPPGATDLVVKLKRV